MELGKHMLTKLTYQGQNEFQQRQVPPACPQEIGRRKAGAHS